MDDISRRGFLASMLVLGGGAALARKLPAARLGEVVQPVPRPAPVARPVPGMALRRITAFAKSGHGTIGVLRNEQAVMAATFDRHLDVHLPDPLVVHRNDTMQIAFRDTDVTDLAVSLLFEDDGGWVAKNLTVPGQVHGAGTFQPLFLT